VALKRSPFYLRLVSGDSLAAAPLSVEELETGLRLLGRGEIDQKVFWDENIEAFRQTVLLAIRDTSDALLSPTIKLRWRIRLERELEALVQYLELADRYLARRSLSCEQPAPELPSSRIH
jgi:hypothetical protein